MAMHGGFKRKSKVASEIPDSSLADIAFLLLIFFMVTTVFRKEQRREIEQPGRGRRRSRWTRSGRTSCTSGWSGTARSSSTTRIVPMEAIAPLVRQAYEETNRAAGGRDPVGSGGAVRYDQPDHRGAA
jgi:hypothetical protein